MRLITIFFLLSCVICFSCKNNQWPGKPDVYTSIRIQPFDDMDSTAIMNLAYSVRKIFPNVVVNQRVKIPAFAYYPPRGRYRADSLLRFLQLFARPHEVVIGVTNKDISTHNGNISDWGVMGLGNCPGNSCVVSTFRLNRDKNKNQLLKVAIHELGHCFGLPHCPERFCFMRDARGRNVTDEETVFCKGCKHFLILRHWRIP